MSAAVPYSPGRSGTSADRIRSLATAFDPIASIALAGGPTKVTFASSHAAAKAAFSDKNPYPG